MRVHERDKDRPKYWSEPGGGVVHNLEAIWNIKDSGDGDWWVVANLVRTGRWRGQYFEGIHNRALKDIITGRNSAYEDT